MSLPRFCAAGSIEIPSTAIKAMPVMRNIEGLSNAEPAEVLGTTVLAIKSLLHRARLALRQRLAANFEADGRGRRAYALPLRERGDAGEKSQH